MNLYTLTPSPVEPTSSTLYDVPNIVDFTISELPSNSVSIICISLGSPHSGGLCVKYPYAPVPLLGLIVICTDKSVLLNFVVQDPYAISCGSLIILPRPNTPYIWFLKFVLLAVNRNASASFDISSPFFDTSGIIGPRFLLYASRSLPSIVIPLYFSIAERIVFTCTDGCKYLGFDNPIPKFTPQNATPGYSLVVFPSKMVVFSFQSMRSASSSSSCGPKSRRPLSNRGWKLSTLPHVSVTLIVSAISVTTANPCVNSGTPSWYNAAGRRTYGASASTSGRAAWPIACIFVGVGGSATL